MTPATATTHPKGATPRLHEQLSRALASEIESGRHRPNDRLTEESVAERFGVSRGTVRNAFRGLEALGLLARAGGRGMVVAANVQTRPAAAAQEAANLLDTAASWEAIYEDVAQTAVVHAAYGEWRVVETELAGCYEVSRTVAREVLARLEHRGVLRKEGNTRWRLPMLTNARLADLYEMRRILEPVALVQAMRRAPPDLLPEMRAELETACRDPGTLDVDAYDYLEKRLHVDFLSFASNTILSDSLRNYHALFITNSSLYRAVGKKFGREPFPAEHIIIVDALLEGSASKAIDLLSEHLSISLDRVVARIKYMRENVQLKTCEYLKSSVAPRRAVGF